MPVITYTAVNRGELVGGHTATTSYQIETKLQGFPRTQVVKRQLNEALDGTPEAYVHAMQWTYEIQSDFIPVSLRPNWREFLSSVFGAEKFQIDFTGTIASPGTNVNVWLVSESVVESQLGGVGVQYSFKVKVYP